jgi:hypothetical protein
MPPFGLFNRASAISIQIGNDNADVCMLAPRPVVCVRPRLTMVRLFPWQMRDESPAGQPGPLGESQCAVSVTHHLKTEEIQV